MRIGINCGHTVSGQPGCGAVGFIDESVETRNVGYALMDLFRKGGHTVVDCTNDRAETTTANLKEICRLANAQPLDLFVSIHFNAGGGKGSEVYTYSGQRHAEAVAVCDKLHALGFTNRGVKNASLYVINHTNAKAMLIEVCFVDTKSDVDLYRKLGKDKIAAAIYEAITGQTAKTETVQKEADEVSREEYNALAARIEKLEKQQDTMIYNYIDKNMPSWAHEAVKWCVEKGIIQGTGNGELGLNNTKLWVCVVLYRTAKYMAKLVGMKI